MVVKVTEYKETDKAICIFVTNNGIKKGLWFPKSQISRFENYALFEKGTHDVLEVPDWLYNQKFKENFGG